MILETVEEFAEEILRPAARDADDAAAYPAGPDHQGRRTRYHRDQHPRGFRRHRRSALHGDQRAGRRGAVLRRHGPGATDPGAGRRRVGADPLGQRRSTGHLPQGVRRRQRPSGVRGDRRAAGAVRPDRAEDHRGAHPERIPADRRQVAGAGRLGRRTVHRRRPTERQAGAVHRRVVDAGPVRQGRPEHGHPRRRAGPRRTRQCAGAARRAARRGRAPPAPTDTTTPRRSRWPGWAGPHWRSAPPMRCSTTSSPTSRNARRSASRSPAARRSRSCAPTSPSNSTGCD